MLPELDGWKLIETARAEGIGTPIVVVSARGTEHDRVHALEIGADDYLVKPFSMRELVARVGAAARRGVRPQEERRGEAIEIEELRIDPREVQAFVDGRSAELTPTEFKLLYTLALDRGRVVTRDELLQKVWGRRETHRDRTVDVFVRRLRQKIDRNASQHSFIQTRFGVGYKLEPELKWLTASVARRRELPAHRPACQRTIFPFLTRNTAAASVPGPSQRCCGRSVSLKIASTWSLLRGSSSVIARRTAAPRSSAPRRRESRGRTRRPGSPARRRRTGARASLSFRSSAALHARTTCPGELVLWPPQAVSASTASVIAASLMRIVCPPWTST